MDRHAKMGTHAIVRFVDKSGKVILAVYHQYDGYPSGVGLVLANFLLKHKLCYGIPSHPPGGGKIWSNGMECMAAQYIAEVKTRPGTVYIAGADEQDEYNYTVVENDDESVKINCNDISLMTVQEFIEWVQQN